MGLEIVQGFEVTGPFQSGGNFGKDGKYTEFLQVTAAKSIENIKK